MNIKIQIEEIAVKSFAQAMKLSPRDSGLFKQEMTVDVDGETKQLLIFGKTYKPFGDGSCYAVLNPSQKILDCAQPQFSYEKCAFVGQCDMVSYQFINTNGKEPAVTGGYSYKAKKPQPARTLMS